MPLAVAVSQPLDKPAWSPPTGVASFEGKVRRVLQAQVAAAADVASRSYHYDTHWVNTFNDRKYFHFELVFFIDPKFSELEFAKVYWAYLKTVWEAIKFNNKVFKFNFVLNLNRLTDF